jgi:glycerol-3-phosphate dehydrogenase
VRYACRHEYAETLIDVVARRMRLAFIDVRATQQVIPEVTLIMTQEKKWSSAERQRQLQLLEAYLKTMGSEALKDEVVAAAAAATTKATKTNAKSS